MVEPPPESAEGGSGLETDASASSQTLTAAVTNPLGKQTTYTFVDGKPTDVSGAATTRCPATFKSRTYDANGFDNPVFDFANGLIDYDYNAKGQLQQKIEKQVNANGTHTTLRTTTFVWDGVKNRFLKETVIGDRETTFTYNADGCLTSVAVKNLSANGSAGQTLTTTYSYTKRTNGMVSQMVVDGPLAGTGDALTYNHDTAGNLTSVNNGLGHTVTYSLYNGRGQPGRIVDANGGATEFTHYDRGRLTRVRTFPGGVAADTVYTYLASGLLASVAAPDGSRQDYGYDTARRLLTTRQPEAPGAAVQTLAYNAASDVTTVTITRKTALILPPNFGHPSKRPWTARTPPG